MSVVQDRNRPGSTTSQDLLLNLSTGRDRLASVMTREFITGKHPVSKCSNMLQTGILDIKERETRIAFQKRAAKQSHARECDIGVHSTLSVLRKEEMDSAQDASSASCPSQRFESGRNLQWKIICATMNIRFVQWVTSCSAAIRRFVPWVTMCFLNQRKNKWENRLNQRSRKSLRNLLKKQMMETSWCWSSLQNKTGVRCSWKKHFAVVHRI